MRKRKLKLNKKVVSLIFGFFVSILLFSSKDFEQIKHFKLQFSNFFSALYKPKAFFKNQSLVKFQETWFYHDHFQNLGKPDIDYLSDFDKKYDINLWELAINERIFYRFNNVYKFSSDEN